MISFSANPQTGQVSVESIVIETITIPLTVVGRCRLCERLVVFAAMYAAGPPERSCRTSHRSDATGPFDQTVQQGRHVLDRHAAVRRAKQIQQSQRPPLVLLAPVVDQIAEVVNHALDLRSQLPEVQAQDRRDLRVAPVMARNIMQMRRPSGSDPSNVVRVPSILNAA